jgi:hypothetical protein
VGESHADLVTFIDAFVVLNLGLNFHENYGYEIGEFLCPSNL